MPIKIETNKNTTGQSLFVDKKKQGIVDIYGYKNPKIIIREGQNFTGVKENNNKDNSGVILVDKKDNIDVELTDKFKERINQLGGNHYYTNYLKCKEKYLQLKYRWVSNLVFTQR